MLNSTDFLAVIDRTPLVSIDLIVPDARGRYLLGQRVNRPAKGYWFVPGGRIYKDERLDAAFARIALAELGRSARRGDARLLGVYEHLYDDNVRGVEHVTTHYVVLGYELPFDALAPTPPLDQHAAYAWMSTQEILTDARVHANTKAYFSS
jgi:colanic acid biosynthesis protein WcaH